MEPDREALREQYLAAIDHEIAEGRSRLGRAREASDEDAPPRTKTLAAISDVTLEWLEAERERLRGGGSFDEDAARRFLSMDD